MCAAISDGEGWFFVFVSTFNHTHQKPEPVTVGAGTVSHRSGCGRLYLCYRRFFALNFQICDYFNYFFVGKSPRQSCRNTPLNSARSVLRSDRGPLLWI